jgi:hypothetical protein
MYILDNPGLGQVPTGCLKRVPAEQYSNRCLSLRERRDLYEEGSGENDRFIQIFAPLSVQSQYRGQNRWRFYFKPEEFVLPAGLPTALAPSYKPPFPNISTKRRDLYSSALEADTAFRKLAFFKSKYHRLRAAAEAATLSLDERGRLRVNPERRSLMNLIGEKIVEKIYDTVVETGVNVSFAEETAARILGVLDVLSKLKGAYDQIQAERLVARQADRLRDEAFKYKLAYFIALMVPEVQKEGLFPDPGDARNWLEHNYWRYDGAFKTWQRFDALEQDLQRGGGPPRQSTMYAR